MWRTALTYSIAFFCMAVGIGFATYKHVALTFPIAPNTEINSWYIELQSTFQSPDKRVTEDKQPTISVIAPATNDDYAVVNMQTLHHSFGKQTHLDAGQKTLEFSKRRPESTESIHLRFMLYELEGGQSARLKPKDIPPQYLKNAYSSENRLYNPDELLLSVYDSIDSYVSEALNKSTSPRSFLFELSQILKNNKEGAAFLVQQMDVPDNYGLIVALAQVAGYPARVANGLELHDTMVRSARLKKWVEILDDGRWQRFDLAKGEFMDQTAPLYLWWIGNTPLVSAKYFKQFVTTVSVKPNTDSAISRALWQSSETQPLAARLSIQNLPLEQQIVLGILLLLPLGGLIVAFVRQVIGVRTFGTFMPVLIALALRDTGLVRGLMLFVGLTMLGLMLRGYLNKLRLLFVPRLAAVLCMVVALITLIMLLFQGSDMSVGMSVMLFPVVIMTMFIERMSNMWEEKGAKGTLIAFFWTMVMACVVYVIAVNEYVRHAMLTFPELLLVIFGGCLILGRYNGYRLTEYMRFRQLQKSLRALQEKQSASTPASE
jgi:hypothetical protein